MAKRLIARAERALAALLARGHFDYWTARPVASFPGLERLGSDYGGWVVPVGLLDEASICYCAGVGLDVTFDLALIDRIGCTVHAFDPTPRARAFAEEVAAGEPRFRYAPVGLWGEDAQLRFYAPADPAHVSHSILNLQQTENYFEAPCRSVASLMAERGHERIDLLKLDIEGAEYEVLDALLAQGIRPGLLCVEFDELHHPVDGGFRRRIRARTGRLRAAGYRLIVADGCNYTLVHDAWRAARAA